MIDMLVVLKICPELVLIRLFTCSFMYIYNSSVCLCFAFLWFLLILPSGE